MTVAWKREHVSTFSIHSLLLTAGLQLFSIDLFQVAQRQALFFEVGDEHLEVQKPPATSLPSWCPPMTDSMRSGFKLS